MRPGGALARAAAPHSPRPARVPALPSAQPPFLRVLFSHVSSPTIVPLQAILSPAAALPAQDVANYVSAPDAANDYINGFLLGAMAFSAVEIALNIAFRPNLRCGSCSAAQRAEGPGMLRPGAAAWRCVVAGTPSLPGDTQWAAAFVRCS